MATSIAFDIVARDRASATFNKVGRSADGMGNSADRSGGKFRKFGALAKTGGLAAAAAFAIVAKGAISLEAEFGKTMNVLGATLNEPTKALEELAMKMGSETVFSANDASKAMLELARGGMKSAEIQGGALAGTLTLAAAGELEMGEAANIAVKSMGQFGLKGKDMASVAAALAGGANASSSSVRDLSFALAQGGLAANSVGFSLQETTGILAAFSNRGLEGSDAGTAMKTMLDRLQPTTTAAKAALKGLGAITEEGRNKFIKANGEFKSAAEIAEILHKGTKKLDEAERKRLITQAFGSDAQRGATILAEIGAKGINKMTEATNDQSAAERAAAANMEGTAGAIEKLKGAAETAQLQLGMALAPAVIFVADALSEKVIPAVTSFIGALSGADSANRKLSPTMQKVGGVVRDLAGWIGDKLVPAYISLWKDALEGARGMFKNIGTAMEDNKPFIDALVEGLKNLGDFLVTKVMPAMGEMYKTVLPALGKVIGTQIGNLRKLSVAFLSMASFGVKAFRHLYNAAFTTFSGILRAASLGLGWVPGLGNKIEKARRAFVEFKDGTVAALDKTAEALDKTRRAIDGIKPKKVTIDVTARYHGFRNPNGPGYTDPTVRNARGTGYFRGGTTWVGEEGPELVELPTGSRINNHGTSMRMAGGAGGEIDYGRLADAIVRALERGTQLVRLPDAGRGAYLQGASL